MTITHLFSIAFVSTASTLLMLACSGIFLTNAWLLPCGFVIATVISHAAGCGRLSIKFDLE